MAHGWIVVNHKYAMHSSAEAAFKERDRLADLMPKKDFYVVRVRRGFVQRPEQETTEKQNA